MAGFPCILRTSVNKRILLFILQSATVALCLGILIKVAFELKWLKFEAPRAPRVDPDIVLEGCPFNDTATLQVIFRSLAVGAPRRFGFPVVRIATEKLTYEFAPPVADLARAADTRDLKVGTEPAGDGRIKLRMRRNGGRLHTFLIGVDGVLQCQSTPFREADSPAANALRKIGYATQLESAMTAPGETGLFPFYQEMKEKASRDEVAELLTSSTNPVAIAYCLLYFAEKDEAFCRSHLQYLKADRFPARKYGVGYDMTREAFEEMVFNPNIRWHFTSGVPGR